MTIWKYGIFWILWIVTELSTGIRACLDKEQFLAGLDRLTSLVFEAELLQFGDTETAEEVYVRVTRIIRQPETGWHLQPGNIAHLTGIRPRATDTAGCLPARVRGHIYLWATWNSAVNLRNSDHSLELIPGGLFPAVDASPRLDWNDAGKVGEHTSPEVNSRNFVHDLKPSTIGEQTKFFFDFTSN
ncbi:Agrin [Fasciolopsis buskii]|uniref:Agrin n=1 Tax=Fasciolopsis buskii TaxID=27845 RepID=A0A8E0VMT6_9TREM|nr:Agrin [Fasciolopsis buski]